MTTSTTQRYLTSDEAAELLRVTPQTLRQQRWRGSGPPFVRLDGRVLYAADDVARWLAARRVVPRTQQGRLSAAA
jgi:DNA-binding transcriptional MerR regulator